MTEAAAAADTLLLHATCIALDGSGVLLRGAPGSGKSDLALRLIDQPGRGTGTDDIAGRLVADDQVHLKRRGDRLFAAPPPALAGLLEIRGLGIVRIPHAEEVPVRLVVDLVPEGTIERHPDRPATAEFLGLAVPATAVDPRTSSAPARVRAALACIAGFHNPA
jgi:serine kinase of HPr protein (carbohydrate metabolism regulator)